MARKPGRMANLGDKTVTQTNEQLSEQEFQLLLQTDINWELIQPNVTDQNTFNKLMREVQEATLNNESQVELKNRLAKLGKESLSVAKKIISLIK